MGKGEKRLLRVGWWAAVTVRKGVFPLRCYVGQVEAIGEQGVRLALVDWVQGKANGHGLFVPWASLEGAYVASDKHELKAFADYVGPWQTQLNATDHRLEEMKKQSGDDQA